MRPAAFAVHPEPVTGDPSTMRWVIVQQAPGLLGRWLAGGRIRRMVSEHAALWITLDAAISWRAVGAEVRDALIDALSVVPQGAGPSADSGMPGGWRIAAAPEQVLELVSRDVLDGPVGEFVLAHGGVIRIVSTADDVLTVNLDGACGHCAFAGVTLNERLKTAVRQRYPRIREVRTEDCAGSGPSWWGLRRSGRNSAS